jgi:phosphohistidine phosphatase
MKTLLLMRHGKSSWKDDNLADFDRPLKKRGKRDVAKMAEMMKQERLIPDYVLASPAVRSRETVEVLAKELDLDDDMIEYVEEFYQAEIEDYLGALSDVTDSFRKVLIVAHNPTLEALLQTIAGEIEPLTTSAIACIKVGIASWEELEEEEEEVGQLVDVWRPKEI